jgi:hypothetical protein
MTWYEMVHKINTTFAEMYLETNDDLKKAIIKKSQDSMYEILKIETLARIATALEKLADCNIDTHSEDYLGENN